MALDETAWLAVLGIAGTLVGTLTGTVLGPWVNEAARRKSELKLRVHDQQVATYAELLTAVTRLVDNARERSAIPLADLPEPDQDELSRLSGRARVVAGKNVRRELSRLSKLFNQYNTGLFQAQMHHSQLRQRADVADDVQAINQRLSLGRIAEELTGARNDLEDAMRKDLGT